MSTLLRATCFGSGVILHVSGLCSRQTRRQHTERRARYVVHADLVTELDRRRFAAVFAADANLQLRIGLAALLHAHANKLSYAFAIENGKRILLQDALAQVRRQELVDVVA